MAQLQKDIHFQQLCESMGRVHSISVLHSWLAEQISFSLLGAERRLFNDFRMTVANSA